MEKRPDAFRTISEVAEELDLPQHVLRFWETRFSQIKPLKRGGGRRYYRPDDLDLLRGIRHLLYGQGFTIKGVQRILKEQGVHYVMEIWRSPPEVVLQATSAAPLQGQGPMSPYPHDDGDGDEDYEAPPERGREAVRPVDLSGPHAARPADVASYEPSSRDDYPQIDAGSRESGHAAPAPEAYSPRPAGGAIAEVLPDEPLPAGILPEEAQPRSGFRFMDRLRGGAHAGEAAQGPGGSLSRDDIRRLQSTLFELLECKRLLDQTR
ncbi:MerR family transcriptional regulator [Hartmannibacter diazotrophicus]|uniref:MerR family transcriptional regulator n=1 Tax=Hartmannibacter diazotrophicus TaxID=1482074 RepID=UPI000C16172F